MGDWITTYDFLTLFKEAGGNREQALEWVTWGCLRRGLIATGFSYGLFHAVGEPQAVRHEPPEIQRSIIEKRSWSVIRRVHWNDQCKAIADWERGHFGFECESPEALDYSFERLAYEGVIFDRHSALALIDEFRQSRDLPGLSPIEIRAWILAKHGDLTSKNAWPRFVEEVGQGRAGKYQSFNEIRIELWGELGKKRGRPRKISTSK